MSNSSTLSFRVEDEVIDALDRLAAESGTSRSALAREFLLDGIENADDEVPEHLRHDAKIKRIIASNKATRRAGKFRKEFNDQLQRSFENGETPGEFRRSVAGYIEEAQDMGEMPEDVQQQTGHTTYAEWVRDRLEYYTVAYQASNYEYDPQQGRLDHHEGVQNARQWIDRAETIMEAAETGNGGGSVADRGRDARRYALNALRDGVVPDQIEEQVEDLDNREQAEAVINAAKQIKKANRAVESDSDHPQIE